MAEKQALRGKRILVAGGAGGIASSWCEYLAGQGAKLIVNDVGYLQDERLGGDYDLSSSSHAPADRVVQRIRDAGGEAVADYENVADYEAAGRAVRHCVEAFGGIDILLGATCVSRLAECADLSPEDWDAVIKNNLYPAYNLTKHALPHMIAQRWGRLLYTTSCVIRSFWGSVNYAAAYAGVYSFMRCIANEVRPDGITANCIEPTAAGKTGRRPGGVAFLDRRTRALGIEEKPAAKIVEEAPSPAALAPFVGYLCTEEAAGVTGQHFAVRGGRYAVYDTFREKSYLYKDAAQGDWTLEELKRAMPATLEQELVPLWFPRV